MARGFELAARFTLDALKACSFLGVIVFSPALAQESPQSTEPASQIEMKEPRVAFAAVDWNAARATLADLDATTSNAPAGAPQPGALAQLNAATEKVFPNIAESAVPVLLPFDTAAFLRARSQGATGAAAEYSSGFDPTFFFPVPAGYDAMLTLQPRDNPNLDLIYVRSVNVQISGSTLIYDLAGPSVPDGAPVPELDKAFPGIRRVQLESHVRYTFVRFGMPYFVSIECFDGANRERRLSCREADKVALRLLETLNIAGGKPQSEAAATMRHTISRPQRISPDFAYYAPGDLIPGSGMKGQGGRADATVYSRIRFPIAQAPDYVNSQSFMNWGNCDFTGRVGLGGHGLDAGYRCKVNDKPLEKDESKNYAYPWHDNFCEHRYYYVVQCPAGLGHQGQDIRPSTCLFRSPGIGRCEPYQNDVVAVHDGVLMRAPGDEALYLIVNEPGQHLRFRYLHMDPHQLDAAGMINGRRVSEGEAIGAVGDYGKQPGDTTYHLHFDLQVPTRQGWVFVNPYMTLVAAYERLIGGRGQVVRDAQTVTAGPAPPAANRHSFPNSAPMPVPRPDEASKVAPIDAMVGAGVHAESTIDSLLRIESEPASERKTIAAEHCTTHLLKGHRRGFCRPAIISTRARGQAHIVRSMDRRVSHQGAGTRHHAGDLRTRHARRTTRHGRA